MAGIMNNHRQARWEQDRRGERGMVLIVVLMLIALLALIGTTAMMTSSTELKINGNYRQGFQAFHDAEAGMHAFIAGIQKDGVTFPSNTGDTVSISYAVPTGFFFDSSVALENIGNKRYRFQITGRSGGASKTLEVVLRRKSVFECGLFADGTLDLKEGGSIYSYDSRITPDPNPADYPANSTGDGDVLSNTKVLAYNGTYMDGDVRLGASDTSTDAAYVYTGTSTVTGSAGELVGRVDPDPQGVNSGAMANQFVNCSTVNDNATIVASPDAFSGTAINAGNLDRVTLVGKPGGANFYLSSINLESGAILAVDATAGPVTIYLTGELWAKAGSRINYTGPPTAFTLQSNSTGSIRFYHGNAFKGLIYAPYASVEMKNGADAFGAIWGKTIDIKNAGHFFFDEASKGYHLTNGLVPLAWRDVH